MAGTTKGKKMTKVEAVRRVLADLGQDTKPLKIRDEVKKRFNIAMTVDHVSNAKSDVLKQLRKQAALPAVTKPEPVPMPAVAKPAAVKPAAQKTAAPKAATPAVAKASAKDHGISLADIAVVKGLVGRLGTDQLRGLIGLLAE